MSSLWFVHVSSHSWNQISEEFVTHLLYSCCVPCFREHRDNHPPDEEAVAPSAQTEATGNTNSHEGGVSNPQDTGSDLAPPAPTGPYSGLADLPEYQMLMKRYPKLPTLLWGIATATDPPAGANPSKPKYDFPGLQPKKDKEPWTQEKGVQKGVQVLQKTRNMPGDDSDAIREFSELVRLYKTRKEEEGAAPTFRKKFVQESADVIGQLLRNEKSSAL